TLSATTISYDNPLFFAPFLPLIQRFAPFLPSTIFLIKSFQSLIAALLFSSISCRQQETT
ncbi:TPA: hypothetical protein ACIURQ_004046, partial [Shigella flexneri]